MSNIYIQEPPTNGKVLLKTTIGDIDIELWSKEAPKASRNFVQLCLEGYYDNLIFHRVIKGFIAQGGDPTGTGTGGQSIYGKPFKDEFHQRLKFNRRGLVAMANAGKDDNGSQFFFTLDRTEELNRKHTIFGKVAGHTVYNMVRFNDLEVDEDDRPIAPPKILRTEVLYNPFEDIVPRKTKLKSKDTDINENKGKIKSNSKATKNFTLLSFGEEAEEDDNENNELVQEHKVKSSHDVLDDPKLSSQTSLDIKNSPLKRKISEDDNIEKLRSKLKKEKKPDERKEQNTKDENSSIGEKRKKQLKEESSKLMKEIKSKEKSDTTEQKDKVKNELMEQLVQEKKEFLKEKKERKLLKKGGDREKMTLQLLAGFQDKLHGDHDEEKVETDKQWMFHKLNFEESEERAKDANMKTDDWYDIYDPRNPVNQRRRDASKNKSKKKR